MKIGIGMVGTGFTAGQHAKRLATAPGVVIGAVAGSKPERAMRFCEEHGIVGAEVFGSRADLVEQAGVDAVYFCLPPDAHQGEVERAAARGLHLSLEKPIALDSARAESMVKAIECAGVVS